MPEGKPSRLFGIVVLPLMVGLPVAFLVLQQIRQASKPEAPALNGFNYLTDETQDYSIDHFTRLVNERTTRLGALHPDTLICRNNLAGAILAAGRPQEAEKLQRVLLTDMEKALGPLHPDTFRCRFNLALNLRSQGNLAAARDEMQQVYAGWSQVLGEGHPRTQSALLVLQNLRNSPH